MEAMEAILTRRSIRKYTDQPVPDGLVTELVRAAMAAPSAGNQQPWHFVVVRDPARLAAIATVSQYAGMARDAQLALVICGDLSREKHQGFWVQDCSAATENVLIAANALGLGAVWLGMYPRQDRVDRVRELFDLPEEVIPFCVLSIGYAAEHPDAANRFDPERIHLERW